MLRVALIGLVVLAGCGAEGELGRADLDAGTRPDAGLSDVRADAGAPPIASPLRFREDFDNRAFVESSSTARIDINRGIVTLPTESFPAIDAEASVRLGDEREADGAVRGGEVLVDPSGVLVGHDVVEILARDEVIVAGRIRAGAGGVSIAAGASIRITGAIESAGPVRLKVASADGIIDVSGSIRTVTAGPRGGAIQLVTRGKIRVFGPLSTGGGEGGEGGAIDLYAYGPIELDGARLIAGDGVRGGAVIVRTEALLSASSATLRGGAGHAHPSTVGGGEVELTARAGIVFDRVEVVAGDGQGGGGGGVRIASSGRIDLRGGTRVTSGSGQVSGPLGLDGAGLAVLDSHVEVGRARGRAADLEIGVAGGLAIGEESTISGGDGECVRGGALRLRVAGRVTVGPGAELAGGDSTAPDGDCPTPLGGGDLDLEAHEITPELVAASRAGRGAPEGEARRAANPRLARTPADVEVQTIGWVTSKVFDRGLGHTHPPRLVSAGLSVPVGTLAKIQLTGADAAGGPFDRYADANASEPALLEPLATARFFRYRVWLKGRALDSPVVDYFELDLAP